MGQRQSNNISYETFFGKGRWKNFTVNEIVYYLNNINNLLKKKLPYSVYDNRDVDNIKYYGIFLMDKEYGWAYLDSKAGKDFIVSDNGMEWLSNPCSYDWIYEKLISTSIGKIWLESYTNISFNFLASDYGFEYMINDNKMKIFETQLGKQFKLFVKTKASDPTFVINDFTRLVYKNNLEYFFSYEEKEKEKEVNNKINDNSANNNAVNNKINDNSANNNAVNNIQVMGDI